MDNRPALHLFSGLTSLALYLLLLMVVFSTLITPKFSTDQTQSMPIEINLDLSIMPPAELTALQEAPKAEEVASRPMARSVKDLFSDINYTIGPLREGGERKVSVRKEEKEAKRTPQVDLQKIFETSIKDKSGAAPSKAKNLEVERIKAPSVSVSVVESSEGVFDEYYAKVQEALAKAWRPEPGDEGKRTLIVMDIDQKGGFEFYLKGGNADAAFNTRVSGALKRLQQQGLPPPKKPVTIQVNFVAKE